MRYNAANHALMDARTARGIGMVTPRSKPGRVPAEVKLARMMRNPQKQAVAATPRRTKIAERVMRHSGLATPIIASSVAEARKARLAELSVDQIQRLARCA